MRHLITTAFTLLATLTLTAQVQYNQQQQDSPYADEPKQPANIELTAQQLWYRPFGRYTLDLLFSIGEPTQICALSYYGITIKEGTYPITNTHLQNTILQSVGYNQPSVYKNADSYWYLTSGTLTITAIADDNWQFEIDAYSYYGSHIIIHYQGACEPTNSNNAFSYNAENTTLDDIYINFDDANCKAQTTYNAGVIDMVMQSDTATMHLQLVSQTDELQQGSYQVSDNADNNTILASPGSTVMSEYYGTTLLIYNAQKKLKHSFFITQGNMTLEISNNEYRITFDAQSYKGTNIHITYHGKFGTALSLQQTTTQPHRNTNNIRYNLLGQPVGDDYHGIIILNGCKLMQ